MTEPRIPPQHSKEPAPPLPEPGVMKTDAEELDRELDVGIEQSMDASDPPAVTQPDVKIHDPAGREDRTPGAGGRTAP